MAELAPVCPHADYKGKPCNRLMSLRPEEDGVWHCRRCQRNYSPESPEWPTIQWRERRPGPIPKDLGPQWGWMRVPYPIYEATGIYCTEQAIREGGMKPLSFTRVVSEALAAYPPIKEIMDRKRP